jgi:hypothetical protein
MVGIRYTVSPTMVRDGIADDKVWFCGIASAVGIAALDIN